MAIPATVGFDPSANQIGNTTLLHLVSEDFPADSRSGHHVRMRTVEAIAMKHVYVSQLDFYCHAYVSS